jgi:Ni,Fe-hydrogenase I large subunit
MSSTVKIDPVTRIEGHLAVRVEVEGGRVVKAFCAGEMFRGFEVLLKGRDPQDAQQITQRICGVCPVAHGIASVLAQDQAYGITVSDNGRLLRNVIQAGDFIHSHILHFYQLSAADFVDVAAVAKYAGGDPQLRKLRSWIEQEQAAGGAYPGAPLLPRYEGKYIESAELNFTAMRHWLEALEMRKLAHKMGAVFGGKLPHAAALVPGGVTEKVTARAIAACAAMLEELQTFIDTAYLPDVLAVAAALPEYFRLGKGPGNFLSYGAFPESGAGGGGGGKLLPPGVITGGELGELDASRIAEDVACSRFSSASGLHPREGDTVPAPRKSGAYSWIKAPRYAGLPMEVGPLARLLVACRRRVPEPVKAVDDLLAKAKVGPDALNSVMGRHAARAIECKIIADRCAKWLAQLRPDQPAFVDFKVPAAASGVGLTEAPRGALGHWLTIRDRKIASYQCVVPTSWNCSPRDDRGRPGPVEQALEGTPVADEKNPIEAARVVRSFDPCIACAVH